MGYGIRADYTENPIPAYYLDDVPSVRGVTFQPDVYGMAELLAQVIEDHAEFDAPNATPTIVDVGCGWAEKLDALHDRHPDWTFLGIDYDMNLAHCRESYDWGEWLQVNLDRDHYIPADGAVVIFSDVIEHLVNPLWVLNALRESGAEYIVLSTPDRNVEHGWDHVGPSPNLCHVREWSSEELHNYLTECGFTILHHGLTRGSDQGWAMGTQLVVMQP